MSIVNKWRTISLKNAALILLVVLLLVAAALMNWFAMGKSNHLNQVTQNYNNQQLQLLTMQGQLAKLSKEVSSQKGNSVSIAELLAKQLPSSLNITDALVQITKLAALDQLNLQSFTYSNSTNTTTSTSSSSLTAQSGASTLTLSSLPFATVNISVAGQIAKVKKFILDLEHQTQLTAVQSFSLDYGSKGTTTVSINLAMYYQ